MQNEYMNNDPQPIPEYQGMQDNGMGGVPYANGASGQEAPQPAKKKNFGAMIGVAVAAVVIVGIVVAGFLTNWFGLAGGPLGTLVTAFEKTITSNSMTAEASVTRKSDGYKDKTKGDIRFQYDKKEEKFLIWVESDDAVTALDGKYIYYCSDSYAYTEKIDDDYYFELYTDFRNSKEIDYDDIIDTLELDDYVKGRKIEGFLETFKKECLGNKEWLQDYLGFEKNGNTYSFCAEVDELLEELIDRMDEARVLDLDSDDVDELIEMYEGVELEATVVIKNNTVSQFTFEMSDDEYSIEFDLELTDINKTKITQDELDELENDIEAFGEDEDDDDYEHDHDDDYDYDYTETEADDDYGYCDNCNAYEELYYWYGDYLCFDCYLDA